MKAGYDVIIIGGGIVGCATAFELAKRGITDVLLIEKRFLDAGATGRCGAGIRQQWGAELNASIALESTHILVHLEEYTGYDHSIELHQGGYLLVDRLFPGIEGRDIIAASILMIMTGLSMMVLRKRAIIQMCGLITLENGIYLLGLLITEGLPMVVELGVFLDVLIAAVVLVILTNRMSLSFMTTDTTVMRKLKG